MIPGPEYVHKCSKCFNYIKSSSLTSGNTFGSKLYSDGKLEAEMLPEFPFLIKCYRCDTFLWIDKLETVNVYDWDDDFGDDWEKADRAEFLSLNEYFKTLETGIAKTEEEEFYVRKHIWWKFNDRIRSGGNLCYDVNEELMWRENCISIQKLLDVSNSDQKIIHAELHRNLGNFEKCLIVLNSIDDNIDKDLHWIKGKLIEECRKKNSLVIQLR